MRTEPSAVESWPPLPWDGWKDTATTLHMWTQIVGKTRLALTPLLNHWWNVPLYVTARGLSTSSMPYREHLLEVEFDFIDHRLQARLSSGDSSAIQLRPQSVAAFYEEYMDMLRSLDVEVKINAKPVEVADPIPFADDRQHASYDADAVGRLWRILQQCDTIFKSFRAGFIGKSSPVHFFWGSFDLAVTRFSGRPAPPRPEADAITREAYSHEVISAGFWPGNGGFGTPAFYCYAAPEPSGLKQQQISPASAFYSGDLNEFILKYDDVRQADSPEQTLLEFLESSYQAAADLAKWDRTALERLSKGAHASM
ncbi:MAG: DUF5996 family protein [Bryobacteraceae bacterium]